MEIKEVIRESYKLREQILANHRDRCDKCKSIKRLELHHNHYDFVDLDNIQVLCMKCHRAEHKGKGKFRKGLTHINIYIPDDLHKKFKMRCVEIERDMKDVVLELMAKFVTKK